MPEDKAHNTARVEALLATALEAANDPDLDPEGPLPPEVQSHLLAMGAMGEAPGEEGEDEEGEERMLDEDEDMEDMEEETPPIPAPSR